MEIKDLCEKKVDLTPCHEQTKVDPTPCHEQTKVDPTPCPDLSFQFQQLASKHFSEKDITEPGIIQLLSSMQKSFMSQIVRIEANMDYYGLIMKQLNAKCLKDIKKEECIPKSVVYQGLEGAWSSVAAKEIYPGIDIQSVPKFRDVFESVSHNKGTVGILPIDNSIAGAVTEVYDYLTKYNLYIVKSLSIPIKHCLASTTNDINNIKRVISHPQALAQCSEVIENLGLEIFPSTNTAVAASTVSNNRNYEEAVLCSFEAARKENLNILMDNANNYEFNETRFISVSSSCCVEETANKISLNLTLRHEKGSLSEVIAAFNDFDINLTKIQSRPIPHRPFEFCFYLDFEGNVNEVNTKLLILKFENELPEFRFLGNYCQRTKGQIKCKLRKENCYT